MTKLSTLRDILLKAAAINFDTVFLDKDQVQGNVFKKDIHLPPHLFEDIMLKGSDIGWPIPSQFLMPCLAFRDSLNWVNVDLSHGFYDVNDLLMVQDASLPLKQFSFRVYMMTSELISLIVKYAHCLEILNVGYHQIQRNELREKEMEKYGESLQDFEMPLKFPKLKKLAINFLVNYVHKIVYIDFTSCSETLESIEYNFFCWTRIIPYHTIAHFLDSCANMSKLKNLTFNEGDSFLRRRMELEKLKSLRSLNLLRATFMCHDLLGVTLECLSHLESLNLHDNSYRNIDISYVKSKTLKYFGLYSWSVKGIDIPDIEKYAKTVGSRVNLDSMLTYFEHLQPFEKFETAEFEGVVKPIMINPISVTATQWLRMEKIILYVIQQFWKEDQLDQIGHANFAFEYVDKNHQWTTDFKKKFSNLITNFALHFKFMETQSFVWIFDLWESQQMLGFLVDYITRHPNTATAHHYLTYLVLSNIYFNTDISIDDLLNLTNYTKASQLIYRKLNKPVTMSQLFDKDYRL